MNTTQRTKPQNRWLLPALALFAATALEAQTAAAPQPPAKPVGVEEDVIELSPFVVNTSDDKGYAASGTLAGTRLRQDLRDVAASVQIMTKQFITDVGANNLADLLVYSTGTEVNGIGGNYSGSTTSGSFTDFDQGNRNGNTGVRIRGIGSGSSSAADQALDYFITSIPTDSYNVDRVEINRGPNAMLFGLGSPSGIVNSSLIKARLNRTSTSAEFKLGSFGSTRATLDHNQVLIDDKLAFRVAALVGTQKYMQDPAYDQNRRIYATMTYKPFRDTTIKLSGEMARRMSNKPQTRPPFDSIQNWYLTGKPTYDPTTGYLSFLGTPPPILLPNGQVNPIFPGSLSTIGGVPNQWNGGRNSNVIGQLAGGNGAIVVVNENPNVRNFGITGYNNIIAFDVLNQRLHPIYINPPTSPGPTTNVLADDGFSNMGNPQVFIRNLNTGLTSNPNQTNYTPTLGNAALMPNGQPYNLTFNFWKTPQMTDPSVFDFYHQMLDGPNKKEGTRWKTANIVVEQRLGSHAGVEVAGDIQQLDLAYNNNFQSNQYLINVDINSKLPDGGINPNFGRPYVANDGWAGSSNVDRWAWRATAYYDLDLRKVSKSWVGKILGRHTFTGNVTQAQLFEDFFGGRPAYSGLDYVNSENATVSGAAFGTTGNSGKRSIWRLNYIGPSLLNTTNAQNAGIQNLKVDTGFSDYDVINTRYYQSPVNFSRTPSTWQDVGFTQLHDKSFWNRRDGNGQFDLRRRQNRSLSQVFIANSRFLDDNLITTLGWRRDEFRSWNAGTTQDNLATGNKITDEAIWSLDNNKAVQKVSTFSYGIVGHVPQFIREKLPLGLDVSLTYNKSDNSAPENPRTSIYGNLIPSPTGKTEELGGRIAMLDGKFELRVVKFETTAAYAAVSELQSPKNTIINAIVAQDKVFTNGSANRTVAEPQRDAGLPPTPDAANGRAEWNKFFATPEALAFLKTFNFTDMGTGQVRADQRDTTVFSTSDVLATGWDYELIYNPTKNWRISANAAEAVTVRSNSGEELNDFSERLFKLFQGPAGLLPTDTAITSVNSLQDKFLSPTVDIRKQRDLDGSPSPEQRKWRYNIVTNYSFSNGLLKNVGIGGAIRWQDKSAIGFPVINKPLGKIIYNPVYDVTQPFYGPSETNYDAWVSYSRQLKGGVKWSVKLNVKNLGVDKKLIPVFAQPDGTIGAYRIAEPMTWTLSNKFDF